MPREVPNYNFDHVRKWKDSMCSSFKQPSETCKQAAAEPERCLVTQLCDRTGHVQAGTALGREDEQACDDNMPCKVHSSTGSLCDLCTV